MDFMELDPIVEAILYRPLQENEIRLALLQPGASKTPITVSLVPVNIAAHPEYDALSYVWGDPKNVAPICCDGASTNITTNLIWALDRARFPDRPRLVWADALCINQADAQERSQQVALMGCIYSEASIVLVCMGEDPDGRSAEVASLLGDYGPILARPGGSTELMQLWRSGRSPIQDARWSALGAVMAKPWFSRAWVLQEVGLARNPRTVYGRVEFSYRDLMAIVRHIKTYATDLAAKIGIGALVVHMHWAVWSSNWMTAPAHQKSKMIDLLDHASLLNCQDPRDHIYAFLGHPLARTVGNILPDYTKETLQIYKEATVLLLHDAGVRVLSSVEHNDVTIEQSLPTWVVRWNTSATLNNIYRHPETRYRADGALPGGVLQIHGDMLELRGATVDVVDVVFPLELDPSAMRVVFQRTVHGKTVPGTIFDMIAFLEAPSMPSAYSTPRTENFARTLCCNPFHQEPAQQRIMWTEYLKAQQSPAGQLDWAKAHSFWISMVSSGRGRAFAITRRGLYCIVPRVSRPGDICCIIYGSAVPFIVRPPTPEDPRPMRLVGEAYVHGVMRGEAADMLKSGRLQSSVFRIH